LKAWKSLQPKTRQLIVNLARLAISAGLLVWVISQAGLGDLIGAVRQADPRPYAWALVLSVLGIVVRAYRWHILLRAVGARVSFRRAVYLYFVGAFFNAFLPTGFGGDVVRVLEIGEGATSQQAAGTVLVDRLTGFITLFLLALVALPFGYRLIPAETTLLIAVLAAGVMVGSLLLFEGRLLRRLTARFPRGLSLAGDAWMGKTYAVITACGTRAIAGSLAVSLVFNLIQAVSNVFVARALGIDASVWTFFLFIPVATVVLLAPITISGLGLRENTYLVLFGQVGVAEDKAVAFSIGSYSLDLAMGLVGGVLYFLAGLVSLRRKRGAAPTGTTGSGPA
jgi:uncharacterized membrane protein YbhN (UPF0104 family)